MLNGQISHWMSQRGLTPLHSDPQRSAVQGTVDADICIVGAGYTGLWSAYHLSLARPDVSIAIVEQHTVGYGASGRNAGWLSSLVPGNRRVFARSSSQAEGIRIQRRMLESVDEVLEIIAQHDISGAHALRSGNLVVARNQAALTRLRSRLEADRAWGYRADEGWELSSAEVAERIQVSGAVGGLFYPAVGRIDPAGLVLGLASLLEQRGVRIYEHSAAIQILPGRVHLDAGVIRAATVLRCTEGYSAGLAADPRRIIPINSSIIVTDPLPQRVWDQVGWRDEELFSDAAHVFSYAQRTHDGRILIGGRGNPYRFGSGTGGNGEVDAATLRSLTSRLHAMLPATRSVPIAHTWSGVLGVTRDWCASVVFDRDSGVGHAQGYAGHGVTSAYLAAKSLAECVTGASTGDATLAWVGRQARNWEPEPIRWLGVHGMYRMFSIADWHEERTQAARTSLFARVGSRLAGLHE